MCPCGMCEKQTTAGGRFTIGGVFITRTDHVNVLQNHVNYVNALQNFHAFVRDGSRNFQYGAIVTI